MKILIVDDNLINRELLGATLRRDGHDIKLCQDGQAAFDEFMQARYDAVISDYMMPGINGLELCAMIREISRPHIYFILITAHDEATIRSEMLASTVDDFLLKPYSPTTIRMRLRIAERILRHQTAMTSI